MNKKKNAHFVLNVYIYLKKEKKEREFVHGLSFDLVCLFVV